MSCAFGPARETDLSREAELVGTNPLRVTGCHTEGGLTGSVAAWLLPCKVLECY